MTNCGNMKKDDIYVCKICGLEVKVLTECTCGITDGNTNCKTELKCCGQAMEKEG
ncbi:hypothetical protein [Limisalsivibrio acetivorans]|uniref:hypothetical protein n=1 Tax=Limisalsivibrio acetivorans TaxID=1304888 RepID=UPI0003B6033E|nr:hypothetical protein [Limisalsivibrio acetivorans]